MIEKKYTKHVYNDYKKHHHDTLVIATIKQGEIHIQFDEKEVSLKPNSLVIFNAFKNHKTTVISSDTEDYYLIYFKTDKHFTEEIIHDVSFVKQFLALHNAKDEKEAALFLTRLFNDYGDTSVKNINETLNAVISFIEKQDYDALSLEVLAKYADMSQNHFIRVFKKEFGSSPVAYILNHKIHKAKKLLETDMPIAEVSAEVGFYDQSHFHKAFKRVFGLTPKEFQKR